MSSENVLPVFKIDRTIEREVEVSFTPSSWFRIRYRRYQEGGFVGSDGKHRPWGKVVRELSIRIGSYVVHFGR